MTTRNRTRWFRLAAVMLPVVFLLIMDLGLRVTGFVPPEDPLLFYTRTYQQDFSPFQATPEGMLEIRPDRINPGVNLQATRGTAAGRFFLHPGFRSARISERKPPGTIRIFVLGGSSAYGLYVGEDDAFSGRIRGLLAERHPDRSFEVVNLGCPGWASNRVLNLMGSLMDLDPDLFIVYSGHNELLQGTVDRGPDTEGNRLRLHLLRASTLYRWIDHAVASARRGREFQEVREDMAALEAGNSLVFDPSSLPVEQRQRPPAGVLEDAARQFGVNIAAMIDLGRRHTVPVLIGLPVANLWSPPTIAAGDVLTRNPSPERDRFVAALEALEAGRASDAANQLATLVDSDPDDAGVRYWYGIASQRSGRPDEAAPALQAALDRDVRTHRINSLQENALVEAGGDRVVDLRPALRADASMDEATALFSDHCHPTAEGHGRIAFALLPEIEGLLGL